MRDTGMESKSSGKIMLERKPLLRIAALTIDFDTQTGWIRCLYGVGLEVYPGEMLGLVGESGCGKSITCMAVLRLLGPKTRVGGNIHFFDQDLLTLDEKRMAKIRGSGIAMIFQDPVSSLNPIHTIGRQVTESVIYNTPSSALNHGRYVNVQAKGPNGNQQGLRSRPAREEAERLLDHVGISEPKQRLKDYPHQLSGGMNQRAMIAMALAGRPQLLIADEPTTALDVTIQAQILEQIRSLRNETGMSIILITHDLGVVAETCDRVAVMYCGRIMEIGSAEQIFFNPRHPYTRGLLASLPRIDRRMDKLHPLQGSVPDHYEMPRGCAFEPRCPYSRQECKSSLPDFVVERGGHGFACFNPQVGRLPQ